MQVVIPASHGKAFRLEAGQTAEVASPTGTQVADTWAVGVEDPDEYLSMEHTRSVNSNIFIVRGSKLVSNRRRPMLEILSDTSDSLHDTLLCPCTEEIYRELGVKTAHRSCTQNFHDALAEIGLFMPFTPASLNLFMNVPVAPDGAVDRLPPRTRPGDSILLRAETPLILVMSACPQDITPINGAERRPTELHVTLRLH